MKWRACIGLTCLLALADPRARAATRPPLTLSQAQEEARAHSPGATELAARLRGAELVAKEASRVFRENPAIGIGYESGALSGENGEHSVTAQLNWTVDVSGSWATRRQSAEADLARVAFDRQDGLRALDEAVAIAVAELADAQRSAARLMRIARLEELVADAMQRKLDVGEDDQLQVDAAALDLAAARADVAKVRGSVAVARAELARLLGRTDANGLEVEDPGEAPTEALGAPSIADLRAVEADPRVRAANAELRAASFELDTADRRIWPAPTLGAGYAYRRREVPSGAFSGPTGGGLSAAWSDQEVALSLTLPLPIFDRQQQPRALAAARIAEAEARVFAATEAVGAELQAAWAALCAARDAYTVLAAAPAIIEREFVLLERAVRAGSLDAVTQAQAIRRLLDAGARYDAAVLELRAAQARWVRRARP
jgi:cobalt-zinc-cadmium efflux system outer membrane protein